MVNRIKGSNSYRNLKHKMARSDSRLQKAIDETLLDYICLLEKRIDLMALEFRNEQNRYAKDPDKGDNRADDLHGENVGKREEL